MREKDIEKILVDGVKGIGGRAYKWVSPGNNGVPDRIVFLPGGRIIFVELKTDTGTLSSLQGTWPDGGSRERNKRCDPVLRGLWISGCSIPDPDEI